MSYYKDYELGKHEFAHQISEYLKVYINLWIPNMFVMEQMKIEVHISPFEVNTNINSVLSQNILKCSCQNEKCTK